jgi:DNA-binding NtrC family response regulator
MAAKPALAQKPLCVLLVGKKEEDFYLIREILERTRDMLAAELDHAHSLEEARTMLQQKTYGLVMFEHETGDAEAVHFVAEFLHAGVSVPFILLTDDANEKTVAEIIQGGTWNCVAKSQLDGALWCAPSGIRCRFIPCNRSSRVRSSLCENCHVRWSSRPT